MIVQSSVRKNGNFQRHAMKRALVCQEDIMQGVRKSALMEDIDRIEEVYIERNGEISPIKKWLLWNSNYRSFY